MSNPIELAARVVIDTAEAVAGFDDVGGAAKAMGDDVATAAKSIDDHADRMGKAAEQSDVLASKSSQATGALGALSSGFELVGLDKYATGLQSAAMATDFLSGAGDALNLVTESQIVLTVKAKVQALALAVQEKATAAASKAWAAAQWLLNAAMEANPIGILVVAIVAAVAGFVLLYKKSDKFRALVATIGGVFKKFAGVAGQGLKKVIDAAGVVVRWIRSHFPPLLAVLSAPFRAAAKFIAEKWTAIKAGARAAIGVVKNVLAWSPVALLRRAWSGVEKVITAPFHAAEKVFRGLFGENGVIVGLVNTVMGTITGIINQVIAAINHAIDAINKLPGVDIGHISPVGAAAAAGHGAGAAGYATTRAVAGGAGRSGPAVVNINLPAGSDYTQGKRIAQILTRYGFITGRVAL